MTRQATIKPINIPWALAGVLASPRLIIQPTMPDCSASEPLLAICSLLAEDMLSSSNCIPSDMIFMIS